SSGEPWTEAPWGMIRPLPACFPVPSSRSARCRTLSVSFTQQTPLPSRSHGPQRRPRSVSSPSSRLRSLAAQHNTHTPGLALGDDVVQSVAALRRDLVTRSPHSPGTRPCLRSPTRLRSRVLVPFAVGESRHRLRPGPVYDDAVPPLAAQPRTAPR